MEKLPLYSSDVRRGSRKPLASPRSRWVEKTIYRRLFIIISLIFIWYLFGHPVPQYLNKSMTSKDGFVPETAPMMHKNHQPVQVDQKIKPNKPVSNTRIPLEAHIMSKCPDAQECLQDLVLPAMEQISDKVNFQLSFIAR